MVSENSELRASRDGHQALTKRWTGTVQTAPTSHNRMAKSHGGKRSAVGCLLGGSCDPLSSISHRVGSTISRALVSRTHGAVPVSVRVRAAAPLLTRS